MKSLVQFIKESLINEGGNAVTANPIPAYITPLLYKEIEDSILKENPDIKMVPLGSVGKKNNDQFNGDIDIAVKINTKKELIELIDKVFPDLEKIQTLHQALFLYHIHIIKKAKLEMLKLTL